MAIRSRLNGALWTGMMMLVLVLPTQAKGFAEEKAASPGYFRQPAIHDDTVVFVAEGDLWSVAITGGKAKRLTTHPADEGYPAISPDGKTLAFAASFEGPTEVYVMPLTGGKPRRLTFDSASISYVGWTPDGKVLVGTNAHAGLPNQQLISLDFSAADGGVIRTKVPLAQAADGNFSNDGKTIYFTRLRFQGSHAKRYKGGSAQQLWSYTDGDAEAKSLTTDYPGTSKVPMVWQDRVYFATDRDGTMNLWSIKPDGSDARQHTRHKDFDLKSPALSNGRIVYQLGADLRLYDIAADTDKLIPITIESDFDHTREKWITNPLNFITYAHPSPDGTKVVVTSRGRVFVIPRKGGRLVEAGRKPGVRYRNARFLPDGKSLLCFSDQSGETELWTVPADGAGEAQQWTTDGVVLRRQAVPSPDGKNIAHTDKNQRLFLLNVASRENKEIGQSPVAEFDDLTWSPDSQWLAYTETGPNLFRRIKLYSLATSTATFITTDRYDSYSPTFSPDGKWLYLLSDRNIKSVIKSPWGTYQPEPFLDKKSLVYHIPLTSALRSPFASPTELDPPEKDKKKDDKKEPEVPAVTIDLDGILNRLIPVPVPPGNYSSLAVTDKALFWMTSPSSGDGKSTVEGMLIGSEEPEVKSVADNVTGLVLSADRKKLLIQRDKEYHLADAVLEKPDPKKSLVDLSGWAFAVLPAEEWKQMYVEAWRLERDYFYDRGMHGIDWLAVRKKYEPLLHRVTDRNELDDLIGQLVSELSALHTSVIPGDIRKGADAIAIGYLGAVLLRDGKAGGYRVEHLFRHDPDEPERASPLTRPGIGVKNGDLITTIDGTPVLQATDIGELLRGKIGKQVLLGIQSGAGEPRRVVVKPLSALDEADLRYHEWEYERRLATDSKSENDIGYVHLRAMVDSDFEAWARAYYPVYNRGGLIIDVRNNRGGNIDSWIVGRLLRKAWFYWNQRVGRKNLWNMQYAFRGHIVVLCNEWTGSDGEAFAEAIKQLKLGTVIGTRTWGGEIWLSRTNVLLDKGIASAPELGVFDRNGTWLIEGHGVNPDIVVDNLPHATFRGEDAQLQAAIKYLQKKLKDEPVSLPPVPPFPKK